MGWPSDAFLYLRQIVTPKSRPAPGGNLLYTKSDNGLYLMNSDGTEHAVGGSGGSLTVQDENSNVSTSVTQIDFQGSAVSATNGTSEVIVTVDAVPRYPLDPVTLNATYGDHFTGSSLDAKWTRVGYVSGDEQYQSGNTWLQVDTPRAAANYYYQAAPAGDFTIVMKACVGHVNSVMFGLMIVDNTGAGAGCTPYNSPDAGLTVPLTAAAYTGSGAGTDGILIHGYGSAGAPVWFKLNKTGNVYKGYISANGVVWRKSAGNVTSGITPTRIGFGGLLGTAGQFAIDFFDVQ